MARQLRNIAQGATHHVFTRCHGKKELLKSSHCKKYFIESIKMSQEKYNFELIAAEPVGNHIHLVIKTLEDHETISRIMQYIKSRIAEKYNRSRGLTGSFWNERFGSVVIETVENPEQYLLWLLWYIGYNPVRKGLSSDPRKNYVGFINVYLNKKHRCRIKFTHHTFFVSLGDTFEERVKKFLLYEDAYLKRISVYF